MSDKKVKVAKPQNPKPLPVTPEKMKPGNMKPLKAHGASCVRCSVQLTEKTGTFRQLCSPCDLALQEMHWNTEHQVFRRTVYIPEVPHDGGPPFSWLINNGYADHIRKPSRPYFRSDFRPKLPSPELVRN